MEFLCNFQAHATHSPSSCSTYTTSSFCPFNTPCSLQLLQDYCIRSSVCRNALPLTLITAASPHPSAKLKGTYLPRDHFCDYRSQRKILSFSHHPLPQDPVYFLYSTEHSLNSLCLLFAFLFVSVFHHWSVCSTIAGTSVFTFIVTCLVLRRAPDIQ